MMDMLMYSHNAVMHQIFGACAHDAYGPFVVVALCALLAYAMLRAK